MMVGIRSITYQLTSKFDDELAEVAKISRVWDNSFTPIRTQRICLSPFTESINVSRFKQISDLCDISSIRWFNIPVNPYKSQNIDKLFNFAYSVLNEYGRAFVNILGVVDNKWDTGILNRSADLIRKVSTISPSGKDNFRFGISVNIKPDGPFFPFTYSSGNYGFSIALELTQDINIICAKMQNSNLNELRDEILNCLIPQIKNIQKTAENISEMYSINFKGFDFSIAPIIGDNGSVITILNSMGIYNFGRTGTLFATGFLTNILKHLAKIFPSVGFSGVMYSLLEDLELCSINNERGVSLEQLISLSTMCGCGADMIPVYGQVKNDELMSIFMDVAGISCRLNKPLGIRMLPIPKCGRGCVHFTGFQDDADFIANTKVVTPDLNLITKTKDVFTYLEI